MDRSPSRGVPGKRSEPLWTTRDITRGRFVLRRNGNARQRRRRREKDRGRQPCEKWAICTGQRANPKADVEKKKVDPKTFGRNFQQAEICGDTLPDATTGGKGKCVSGTVRIKGEILKAE